MSDTSGINITGNGHDITLQIDNSNELININNYFKYTKDSYTNGQIEYQLNELSDGTHTLKLKAWDNLNNSSTAEISFEIVNSNKLSISHLLNYPNPFTDITRFQFEHNSYQTPINYEICIYTMSGKLIKTISGISTTAPFTPVMIEWNGKDQHENTIARGVYFYRLKIKNAENQKATAYEKLLYLK